MDGKEFVDPVAKRAAKRFGVAVFVVTLALTAAFKGGAYWHELHAQGTTVHARVVLTGANEELARQAMHRLWEDMQSTLDDYERIISSGGSLSEHATNYTKALRKRLAK